MTNIGGQVFRAITEVIKYAESAATGAEEAKQASGDGSEMVSQTIASMGKIKIAVEAAAVQIADLGT
jgi:methyl-accepting chemotaxis protein